MNNAPEDVKQVLDLYAHGTTLQASVPELSSLEHQLNSNLKSLNEWFITTILVLNTDKTVCMIIGVY